MQRYEGDRGGDGDVDDDNDDLDDLNNKGNDNQGCKWSSFCRTATKKLQNLWPLASKLINSATAAFILILNFDPIK